MAGQLVGVEIDGLDELLRVVEQLPEIAQDEIRKAGQEIADEEADRIRARGRRLGGVAALAARSVKAGNSVFPTIVAGGSGRVDADTSGGAVFFGAEFGGGGRPTTHQFKPRRTKGYFLWPTLRDDDGRMMQRWERVVDAVARAWSGGSGA